MNRNAIYGLVAVVLGFGAGVFYRSALGAEERAPAAAGKTPEQERWRRILREFPPDLSLPAEEKDRIKREFASVDVDQLPPEWRYGFLEERLWWAHRRGDWQDMLAVRDKLMAPGQKGQPLVDADLLYLIALYHTTVVFPPPADPEAVRETAPGPDWEKVAKEIGDKQEAYWREHYRNEAEAERICQYIVDHFDPKYAMVPTALSALAHFQAWQGKNSQCSENYKRLDQIDPAGLYSVDRVELAYAKLVPAAEALQDELQSLQRTKEVRVPLVYIDEALKLPTPQEKEAEFRRLAQKYANNERALSKIQMHLAELAGKRTWGIDDYTSRALTREGFTDHQKFRWE